VWRSMRARLRSLVRLTGLGLLAAALVSAGEPSEQPTAAADEPARPGDAGPRTVLVLLGTGTPVPDPKRWGPALAIVVGDRSYLVDAGSGVVRRAAAAARRHPALQPSKLQRLFLTHLHSDHTLGLPDLMFTGWLASRPTPLAVWGPPGTAAMARQIEAAWQDDIRVRIEGLEPRTTRNYRAVVHEIEAGRVYEDDRVRVDAIAVSHGSWPAAFGYRFQTADRTIVVSGDTRPSESLAKACDGCDVLVHEVYSAAGFARLSKPWQAYHRAFHTSTLELAALANQARPKLLVLVHQLFFGATAADLVREVREAGYAGPVVSGRDLEAF